MEFTVEQLHVTTVGRAIGHNGRRGVWKVPSCPFGIKPKGTEQHEQVGEMTGKKE